VASKQDSGYILARMRFELILAPAAASAFKSLTARRRSEVRDGMEARLRHQPTKVSRSRIKRLRGLSQPQYRLRVGDIRVFYDAVGTRVQILAIVTKAQAEDWLQQEGAPE
jgi:mRNA-degrading endonuclease RelE of RelBE toxin-antitoxin system